MTATRISRVATLAVAAFAWVVIAWLLWRTKVPADLHLPQLDARAVFGAGAVRAGVRYERFLDYAWLGGTVAKVLALVVLVRRGPRLARSLGLGPVNAGLITGVVVMTVLWAVSLPFAVASSRSMTKRRRQTPSRSDSVRVAASSSGTRCWTAASRPGKCGSCSVTNSRTSPACTSGKRLPGALSSASLCSQRSPS